MWTVGTEGVEAAVVYDDTDIVGEHKSNPMAWRRTCWSRTHGPVNREVRNIWRHCNVWHWRQPEHCACCSRICSWRLVAVNERGFVLCIIVIA
jgi:hypothetical protein